MKNKFRIFFIFLLFTTGLRAQEDVYQTEEIAITRLVDGVLMIPPAKEPIPMVIIIAGSGPTDRDGNQPMMTNNSLKLLAEGLYQKNIASFRFDKRIIKEIRNRTVNEEQIRFEHFIDDAVSILKHFENDSRFSKIYILGHSEGSLIGMVAAREGADGFISIAGAGQEIDDVVVDQLAVQAPNLTESARAAFDDLRATGRATDFNPLLSSIFRKEIQPYMLSWMNYNPAEEIKKLEIPVLIINGDKDLQVQVSEAEILKAAKPDAEFHIIKNMNHVLKEVSDMGLENQKSYNRGDLPLSGELIDIISGFIQR